MTKTAKTRKATTTERPRVQRIQTGVRMEKRLVKVLKALAEYLDMTLGDLLEGIVLHAFDGKAPFSPQTLARVAQLEDVYGLDLDASASHRMVEEAKPVAEAPGPSPFDARRVRCQGAFALPVSPDEALALFTPLGEIEWVEGWDPLFLHPASGELEEGQVFVTEAGGETTVWHVARVDLDAREVEYLRLTPGSRVGRVSVRLEAENGGSRVTVGYVFTALSPAGNAVVETFENNYDAMLATWREALESHLDTRS